MTGFRGISDLSGTTPCHDWANYPEALLKVVQRLQGVVIENRPALEIIQRYQGDDTLFYVDPPYVMSSRDNEGADYRYEMTDDEHVALSRGLRSVKGKVLLSGYESDLYSELYADWLCVRKNAYADGARARVEVLWMNYETEGRLL
jgi:DNA adenine methylase